MFSGIFFQDKSLPVLSMRHTTLLRSGQHFTRNWSPVSPRLDPCHTCEQTKTDEIIRAHRSLTVHPVSSAPGRSAISWDGLRRGGGGFSGRAPRYVRNWRRCGRHKRSRSSGWLRGGGRGGGGGDGGSVSESRRFVVETVGVFRGVGIFDDGTVGARPASVRTTIFRRDVVFLLCGHSDGDM